MKVRHGRIEFGLKVAQVSGMNGRLGRYKDFAWFAAKYGRADFVSNALHGEESASADPSAAEAFANDLESLGPTFIKLGQILSSRADLLPPAYLDALSRLQDNIEPFPYEEVERTIRQELGVRISHAFVEFERLPIAAASLGLAAVPPLADLPAVAFPEWLAAALGIAVGWGVGGASLRVLRAEEPRGRRAQGAGAAAGGSPPIGIRNA